MTWVEKIIAEEPYGIGNDQMHLRYTGEEIVRCRDCKHYDDNTISCDYFAHAEYDEVLGYYVDVLEPVEPDGFCKWGERKNG